MIDRSRWDIQYYQRVLATDPIAYWMQDEKQGLVSYDMVTARSDAARNGAYTGVTLGQPGIGDGQTSGLYDGANDYDAIRTASLTAAFNGDEGTAVIWPRVSGAGVWADGAFRYGISLRVDGNNQVLLRKSNAANQVQFRRVTVASGALNINHATATTNNFCMGLTWSLSAGPTGEFRAYFDGVQTGATLANIGAWAGALTANLTAIGAISTVPGDVWDGYLAHGALWDRALSPAEMLSLGVP